MSGSLCNLSQSPLSAYPGVAVALPRQHIRERTVTAAGKRIHLLQSVLPAPLGTPENSWERVGNLQPAPRRLHCQRSDATVLSKLQGCSGHQRPLTPRQQAPSARIEPELLVGLSAVSTALAGKIRGGAKRRADRSVLIDPFRRSPGAEDGPLHTGARAHTDRRGDFGQPSRCVHAFRLVWARACHPDFRGRDVVRERHAPNVMKHYWWESVGGSSRRCRA